MKKNILIIICLYSLLFIGVVLYNSFSLYRANGFTTLLVKNSGFSSIDRYNVQGIFYSPYDNLGIVSIPITIHGIGSLRFAIREFGKKDSFYESIYSTYLFQSGEQFPFGFPIVSSSSNKKFIVSIKSLGSKPAIIGLNSNSKTISKYITTNKEWGKIISNKLLLAVSNLTMLHYLLILFCSVLILVFLKKTTRFVLNKKLFQLFIWYGFPIIFVILFAQSILFSGGISFNSFLFFSLCWLAGNILLSYNRSVTFIGSVILVIFSILCLVLGKTLIVQNLFVWVWAMLFLGAVLLFIPPIKILLNSVRKIAILSEKSYTRIISRVSLKRISIMCALILIAISLFSKKYYLGGDDSKIFYLYPLEFFLNYVSKVGPDTAVSSLTTWLPPSCLTAFVIMMIFLKGIVGNLNLQMMLYTANLIGGLVSFYLLTNYLIPVRNKYSTIAKIFGSFFYVFSIYNYYTLFNSQLIAQFLLSTFPFVLYCFIRAIHEKKFFLLFIAGIVSTVFCYFSVDLPWLGALIISFLPFLVWIYWNNKKNFVLYGVFLIVLIVLLNLHWLVVLPYSSVINSNNGPTSSISVVSENFREQNASGILSLAGDNSVFYPFLNLYHYSIQKNYNWAFLSIFVQWYLKLLPVNILLFILIIYPGIFIKAKNSMRTLYLISLGSFLLSVFYFTAKIGNWGINVFIWSTNNIPGFVMFRNMYDKFGVSLSFTFALLLTISLVTILPRLSDFLTKRIIIIVLAVILLLNAKPFIFDEFNNLSIWTTKNSFSSIESFNTDYLDLVRYIKANADSSRYLWLPLNFGNISQIQDEASPNHFYTGVSPLLFLSGKNDYSGIMSFETYGSEIEDNISKHRLGSLGLLYQKLNVGYVIVNNTITSDIRQSYICDSGLCDMQDGEYKKVIMGEKIRDFGNRYSLYRINPLFSSNKIYLADSVLDFSVANTTVAFKKISNQRYDVSISNLSKKEYLVLLDSYFSQWSIYSGNKKIYGGEHLRPFNYANGWEINPSDLVKQLSPESYMKNTDGSLRVNLEIRFEQSQWYYPSIYITILSFFASVVYLSFILYRKVFTQK